MKLSKYEQETIISYNNDEGLAAIYTADPAAIKRFQKLCEKSPSFLETKRDEVSRWYTCPKKWIKVKVPKEMGEEQRQKQAARLKAYRDEAKEAKNG